MAVTPERALVLKEQRQASMAKAREARAVKLAGRKTAVATITKRLSKLGIREAEDMARGGLLSLISDVEVIAHVKSQILKPGKDGARWFEAVCKSVLGSGGADGPMAPKINVNTFIARPDASPPVIEVTG